MTRRLELSEEQLREIRNYIRENRDKRVADIGLWAKERFPDRFGIETMGRGCWEHIRREAKRAGFSLHPNDPPPTRPVPDDPPSAPPTEHGFTVYVWDLETTNLNTFMGRLTVASFFDLNTERMRTRTICDFPGTFQEQERALLLWVLDRVKEADVLIGHNTKAFDTHFIRGRLAAQQIDRELPKRHHIDTMLVARYGFKGRPQGNSLENLLDFFRCGTQKDHPSKYEWADSIIGDPEAIRRIAHRCEEDVRGTAQLWYKLRPYYHQWKGV